jgi:hypothetical protein
VHSALLATGLTACSSSSADAFAGAVLHEPSRAPGTTLTDTSGRPFSLRADTGLTALLLRVKQVATALGVPVAHGRRLRVVWTRGTTASQYAHDIHQLLS